VVQSLKAVKYVQEIREKEKVQETLGTLRVIKDHGPHLLMSLRAPSHQRYSTVCARVDISLKKNRMSFQLKLKLESY
jgi:hypothetical protein